MPHVGIWSVGGADLRRGRPPGEADPVAQPESRVLFSGREGVSLPASSPPWPAHHRGGGRGSERGWCSSSPRAFPLDEATGRRGFADGGGPSVCQPLRTRPRDVSAETLAERAGRTASLLPLTWAEESSRALGTGWRRLSQPVPTDHQGRPRASMWSAGSRDGTPDSHPAYVTGYYCA